MDAKTRGRSASRVSLACVACRGQHVKCDATLPQCSRCKNLNKQCIYKTMKGRRRLGEPLPSTRHPQEVVPDEQYKAPRTRDWTLPSPEQSKISNRYDSTSANLNPSSHSNVFTNTYLNSYFANFHKGHPFVLPASYLASQIANEPDSVSCLVSVMTFIGSLYLEDARSKVFKQEATECSSNSLAANGFTVQFYLLLAIALEWCDEMDQAGEILDKAKTTALSIGMHRQTFASEYGRGCSIQQESWRRTWWELYIIDALFAGIRHLPTFQLWGKPYDVELPTEETCYSSTLVRQLPCFIISDN